MTGVMKLKFLLRFFGKYPAMRFATVPLWLRNYFRLVQ